MHIDYFCTYYAYHDFSFPFAGRLHFFPENLGNFPKFGKFPKFFPKFSQIFPNSFWEITPTTA